MLWRACAVLETNLAFIMQFQMQAHESWKHIYCWQRKLGYTYASLLF